MNLWLVIEGMHTHGIHWIKKLVYIVLDILEGALFVGLVCLGENKKALLSNVYCECPSMG